MKIAVTTMENDLNSKVCPRFGRTNFFLIVDTQTLEYKAILNPNVNVMGGAGIQSAQLLIKEEVKAVLSGRLGMNAFRVLDTAGILVYENVDGKVRTAIEELNNNKLRPSNKIEEYYFKPGDFTTDRHGYRGGLNKTTENKNIESENMRNEIDKLKMKILFLEDQLKVQKVEPEKQKQD